VLVATIVIAAAPREQPARASAVVSREFDSVTDIRRGIVDCGFSFAMGISNFLTSMFEATSRCGASIHTAGLVRSHFEAPLGASWANR
jgi:hypothetical protein